MHAASTVEDFEVRGVYGQLGCFIPAPWFREHVEVVARGGWSEPNTAFDAQGFQEEVAIDAGLNLYVPEAPKWLHDTKLQVAYRHVIQMEGEEIADDRLDVVGTVRF